MSHFAVLRVILGVIESINEEKPELYSNSMCRQIILGWGLWHSNSPLFKYESFFFLLLLLPFLLRGLASVNDEP